MLILKLILIENYLKGTNDTISHFNAKSPFGHLDVFFLGVFTRFRVEKKQ